MQLKLSRVDWEFRSPFRIAYKTRTHSQTVLVELIDGEHVGRGEASGVSYHGETVDLLFEQLSRMATMVQAGLTRADLQNVMPPGGARSAIDCAMWDLEAKRSGRRVWELAGLSSPRTLVTAYTLGIDTPEAMARSAAAVARYGLLKLKLTGQDDLERVREVRGARPDAQLIVDANQAWNEQQLVELTPQLAALGVKLIEQPLAIGKDDVLRHFDSAVPLCADESCQTTQSLPGLLGKYQYINIKLDKTGGLTEGLRLARAARERGLKVMVGSMGGSSISMAPAFVVGQLCDIVDLDAPLLTKADVPHAIHYDDNRMRAPVAALWG
jgi:L-alanine-DL-glutamate epimerase-like enolase superfamily enzyme